jgi:hypothetical protein
MVSNLSEALAQWSTLVAGALAGTVVFVAMASVTMACLLERPVPFAGVAGMADAKMIWSLLLAGPPGALVGLALAEGCRLATMRGGGR